MSNIDYSTILTGIEGVRIVSSNEKYAQSGAGLPIVVVENQLGSASLALQGCHLLSFVPAHGNDLLWLSPLASFDPDKAIRGGIPLCLPWFGGHPAGLQSHGFARTSDWTLEKASNQPDGSTLLILSLSSTTETLAMWPHAFRFEMQIEVGTELKLTLNVDNLSDTPAPFTYAFHTYFAVDDYTQCPILGLEDLTYIDTVGEVRRLPQEGTLQLTGHTDRVYLDVPEAQTIVDGARQIHIHGTAKSAIVWNAAEHALNIADIGPAYTRYVCVERGDVFDNALTIAPQSRFSSVMTLSETR
ncbi:D-hexose-6-phosphate mutarotase [Chitinibacter bivalviorum]|uniref:Putative glucose-6-phosphate 1-epimerase n=1 Tax=Chitinibacter bivalviorum TaxID=2739434 RepID=A0A7H9BGW9_9NEIS|nr:D-hexose-6-phosphate mutarotase [Chitinibacter bivalviorum]QLG87191.1 D-hexose-6-phosphate mutarotase [Chitinibacter bivalviorum]